MILLDRKQNFSKDPEGVQHFPRGWGGDQKLISIETHITCNFPGGGGGSGPPIPPLDPHMIALNKILQYIFLLILACYFVLGLIISTGYVAHLHSDIEIERGCDNDLARIRDR